MSYLIFKICEHTLLKLSLKVLEKIFIILPVSSALYIFLFMSLNIYVCS